MTDTFLFLQVVDCLIQISDARNRQAVLTTRKEKGQRREGQRRKETQMMRATSGGTGAVDSNADIVMRRSGSHDLHAKRRLADVNTMAGARAFEMTASVAQTDSQAEMLGGGPAPTIGGGPAPTPPLARFISRALSSHVSNADIVLTDPSPTSKPAAAPADSENDGASLIRLPPRHFLRQFIRDDNTNTTTATVASGDSPSNHTSSSHGGLRYGDDERLSLLHGQAKSNESSSAQQGGVQQGGAQQGGADAPEVTCMPSPAALDDDRDSKANPEDDALAAALLEVEPISFPPTQEGYASKIRWYSFQFVLDELVEEIEEAYLSVSCVLNQLPYPIR